MGSHKSVAKQVPSCLSHGTTAVVLAGTVGWPPRLRTGWWPAPAECERGLYSWGECDVNVAIRFTHVVGGRCLMCAVLPLGVAPTVVLGVCSE